MSVGDGKPALLEKWLQIISVGDGKPALLEKWLQIISVGDGKPALLGKIPCTKQICFSV